jgi:hypothetical protein
MAVPANRIIEQAACCAQRQRALTSGKTDQTRKPGLKVPENNGQYVQQGMDNNLLFVSTYPHHQGRTCKDCDRTNSVNWDGRPDTNSQIHYESIGSGDAVIKDGR